ncbi:hypothetical protein [Phormidesmis priestleyi]
MLAISILSLEILASPVRAIPKAPPSPDASSVQQETLPEDSLHKWMGVAAIGMFATPVLGYLLYKQHLAYKQAIRRNTIASLERMWLRSKSR